MTEEMNYRDQFSRLSELQSSGDNEECWREFYTEDVVRRITGLAPLIGRDAFRQQVQSFLDGLTAPQKIEPTASAFDDEKQVSILEFRHDFSHRENGAISQMQTHVQRWREGRIYEENIYIINLET
tara:strand:- start:215 stop:592 length:378 start_codon:yes stop_codon:yes gene_type:complete